MKKSIGVLVVWSMIASSVLANDVMTGKVVSIIDGNTLEIIGEDNQTHKVLLAGVDSPELLQEFGEKAKDFLEKIVLEKNVTVRFQGKDRKGNYLAIVMIEGEVDLRIELLKEGLAWTSERDPLIELEAFRTEAQEKGKGLWKQSDPTPPWIFRRQQTMLQPKSS